MPPPLPIFKYPLHVDKSTRLIYTLFERYVDITCTLCLTYLRETTGKWENWFQLHDITVLVLQHHNYVAPRPPLQQIIAPWPSHCCDVKALQLRKIWEKLAFLTFWKGSILHQTMILFKTWNMKQFLCLGLNQVALLPKPSQNVTDNWK